MRHESLFFLYSSITRIKGVGGATAQALQRLLPTSMVIEGSALPTVRDLLFHLPVGIVDRRFTCPLNAAPEGVIATLVVKVDEHLPPPIKRGSKKPYKVLCSNDTGDITLIFFHAREDYIKGALPIGARRVISGRLEHFDYQLQMTHPDIIAPLDKLAEVQKPEPVYPLTIGLTSRRIAKIVADAIAKLPELPEWINTQKPSPLEGGRELLSWKSALEKAHHPEAPEDLSTDTPARLRLAYDEILANQLYLAMLRRGMQQQAGEIIAGTGKLTGALTKTLPYTLTAGQQQVLGEITADMASGKRMGRLLQGDVGSGKTIVALFAMLRAVEQGLQAALMVPTEIVAQQHFETLSKLLAQIPSPLEGEGQGGGYASDNDRAYGSAAAANAKELRKNPTEAEKKLWSLLRDKQLEQFKFHRQQPIGDYIVDFVCADAMLIIELDGGQHAEREAYDRQRTEFFMLQGYRVLRFWNDEVLENSEGVWVRIAAELKEENGRTPHPTLPLKGEGLKIILLTGSVKGKAREKALADIASGKAQIVVGTHALFQEHVSFGNLALVVIDEQHRFGVNQRMALSSKGNAPHLLHLTATPIPRSLTMTMYGDMDCSQLTEKPAGRRPITTRVIPLSRYKDIMQRLQAALEAGEKAYWICPLIEKATVDGELELTPENDIAAAETRFIEFKARFGDKVGLVHGRMKNDARDKEMCRFASGETRLLVATTVVEVGVDVRDATIMVIEKAERFGLSQLHQLRGRVGRGEKQSSCVLLYSPSPLEGEGGVGGRSTLDGSRTPHPNPPPQGGRGNSALARLFVLRDTEDGFKIAEADLSLRGGGDLLGSRQSGLPRFIFTDLFCHRPLIDHARNDVRQFLEADPTLSSPRGQALTILLQLFGYDSPGSEKLQLKVQPS